MTLNLGVLGARERDACRPFEVALSIVDFAPLRPLLAQIYKVSHKGQVPFDPVSLFLACCLRLELDLSWASVANLLAGKQGSQWRTLFGFQEGDTPSVSGLRYFHQQTAPHFFADLCPSFIDLLRREGLAPENSTYPGDPPECGVTLTVDGMLHAARDHSSCQLATDDCYQPLPEVQPSAPQTTEETSVPSADKPKRPCRARDHGLEGCPCHTAVCQEQCRRASRLDPEARFVHHEWHGKRTQKQEAEGAEDQKRGTAVFGYLSETERLLDERFAVAWNMHTLVRPANNPESKGFPERLAQLQARFPGLNIGEILADAAFGFPDCLEAIWLVGALRMVDIRAAEGDQDPEVCFRRRYDGQGHPLCEHGYRLHYNGYDVKRRRSKWACRQACRREPRREGEPVQLVEGCPYLQEDRPLGQIVNVGRTLPDGSMRLAREIPYGSEAWKARYGRRSLSESRNGQLHGLGLDDMRSYGLDHNTRDLQVGDWICNLRTLGRLVKEASALAAKRGA